MSRICPICSYKEKKYLYNQKFNNSTIAFLESYDIVICKKCGFAYADNIPSQSQFNQYYENLAKYEFNYQDNTVSSDYRNYFENVVKFITKHLDGNKSIKILDIGCASGDLLNIFKEQGYKNLFGLEPSPDCKIKAKDKYDIEIITGSFQNVELSAKYDLVIFSAVIEHLIDITEAIQSARRLLCDNGLLFVEVPDIERFDSYIPAPFQQFNMEHVNFFSKYSLQNFLGINHFSTIVISHEECKADSFIMPDLYILGQKKSINNEYNIKKDNLSEKSIQDYINISSKIANKLDDIVKRKLKDIEQFMIWGVGTHTKQLLDTSLNLDKIKYFIDSNSRYIGKKLRGKDIILPDQIDSTLPILISTHSYQKDIEYQIRQVLKLNNDIIIIYDN